MSKAKDVINLIESDQVGWDVYLKVNDKMKWIDKVFFNKSMDAKEVKDSLVNHDGYSSGIVVKKE